MSEETCSHWDTNKPSHNSQHSHKHTHVLYNVEKRGFSMLIQQLWILVKNAGNVKSWSSVSIII